MAANFPDNPSTNDTFTSGALTFTWNGSAWKLDPSSGTKGEKGQKGEVGVTGDKGQKGQKGEVGDKGQKGEIGATGGSGGAGDKGQKGEVGEKGQKGEIGGTGGTGDKGDKGQKGQDGNDATGTKGQKGEAGAAASKGQKGEVGATGSGGSTGSQGQKGEPGSGGSDGANGSDGDKGQKGEVGTDANLPVGTIVAYGGNSAPTGWQICNGATASTSALQTVLGISNVPDLRDRFIIGAGNSYSRHDTGGSKDAVVVLHNHGVTDPTHGHSVNDPGHFHTTNNYVARSNYAEPRNFGVGTDGNLNSTGDTNSKTTGLVVNAGGTGISINNQGVSGTNKNLPPYYALCYIMKS